MTLARSRLHNPGEFAARFRHCQEKRIPAEPKRELVFHMAKLIGNIRVTGVGEAEGNRSHFEVVFVPYSGKLATRTVSVNTYDDLVAFLIEIRLSEDEATRWAGRVRSGGVILIPDIERTDTLLRENGLLDS